MSEPEPWIADLAAEYAEYLSAIKATGESWRMRERETFAVWVARSRGYYTNTAGVQDCWDNNLSPDTGEPELRPSIRRRAYREAE